MIKSKYKSADVMDKLYSAAGVQATLQFLATIDKEKRSGEIKLKMPDGSWWLITPVQIEE